MILQLLRLKCDCCLVPMITVVIGKIIHGVFVLGRSYYSGSGWYNDDGSFYIWSCSNQSVLMLPILQYIRN